MPATSQDPFKAEIRRAHEHVQAKRLADAERTYRDILAKDPSHPAANLGLGTLLHDAGMDAAAIGHLQTAIAAWPQHLEALFFLAVSLYRLKRLEESAGHLEKVIRHYPDIAAAHNYLGIVKAQLDFSHAAEKHFLRALKLQPALAEAHKNLGTHYGELGRIDEARKHLKKAIALRPLYAQAYWQLASITRFSAYDDDIRVMESSYDRGDIPDTDKMKLAFALGKAFHDLRRYPQAFQYWHAGNRLQHSLTGYNIEPVIAEMRSLKRVFCTTFCARVDRSRTTMPALLFIVGMPRSGTTLTEQILASHSTVFGAGELDSLDLAIRQSVKQFPAGLESLPATGWETIRERYLKEVHTRAGDTACVTNKLPANFLHIGAISQLFPDAKIIHCRRDALDTGLSCFRNHFTSVQLGFTCDLTELGRYYRHYQDLMVHWDQVQTASIYNIDYELLVTEPEREVRRLLDFCELPYEAGCLEFHKNKRAIKTASAVQVRKPIYRDSLQGWKHYEDELQPLKTALEGGTGNLLSHAIDIFSRFRDSLR